MIGLKHLPRFINSVTARDTTADMAITNQKQWGFQINQMSIRYIHTEEQLSTGDCHNDGNGR